MIDFDNLYYENANSKNFCVMAMSCKLIFFLLIIILWWTVFWQLDPEEGTNPPTEATEPTGSGEPVGVRNGANFRSYRIFWAQIRFLDEKILSYWKLC